MDAITKESHVWRDPNGVIEIYPADFTNLGIWESFYVLFEALNFPGIV